MTDIRSAPDVVAAMAAARPEMVLHCAAQPIVRIGHEQPVDTFATNVMGTVHVLEAMRHASVALGVLMTSDKVYLPTDDARPQQEGDRLGGWGPYEASKACCELAVEAYVHSYFTGTGPSCATIRAGNVFGGGDWGVDRLVPDAIRAFAAGRPLCLRRPMAVRPWQHVLDAAAGVLLAAQRACTRGGSIGAFNIGPEATRRCRSANSLGCWPRSGADKPPWRMKRWTAIPSGWC